MSPLYAIAFRAMGCRCAVWLETEADGAAILRGVPAAVERIEAVLSRFRPESELSGLNRAAGMWVTVSETLLQAARSAVNAACLTDGLCNPLVLPALVAAGYDRSFDQLGEVHAQAAPPLADWRSLRVDVAGSRLWLPDGAGLDLGGTGKGWSAAQIAGQLEAYGPCLVDLGGDIVARGKRWQVQVGEPGTGGEAVTTVAVRDRAIVTTGVDYRRWRSNRGVEHHLIDPRTGLPARSDVLSVTVIHPNAPLAEAYAKAVFLLGSAAGLAWLNEQWDTAGLVVREDGAALATDSFLWYQEELA